MAATGTKIYTMIERPGVDGLGWERFPFVFRVTGLTTDMAIELGKLLYWNRKKPNDPHYRRIAVVANRQKLRVHATMIASFLFGGFVGALGFKYIGFISALPLALAPVAIALAPVFRQTPD